ncbi:HTTM domain-containing protein [Gulosibacter molinativorax]|uniref:HTTM domain-containing protein n=1 Tax=Gulosibacter molinativorax TaxID=256821 RepID=A0ABT7C6G9_9MICO|nr:HTTM domain-containing protein [Gulosibacter molinativorax]MDJ1370779.1 HTTM domain-containing protein [Gulosibacter molinativorax]QUY63192.1 Sporulation-delaying protein SdpB [Gulosibacter molinativorax]
MATQTNFGTHVKRFFVALGSLLGGGIASLFRGAGRLISTGYTIAENWLIDTKKATYGLAITRILLGLSAVGLLVSNWRTRLYSFGSGSLWNGEGLEAKSDFPQIWLFSAFHRAMPNDLAYTALYLLLLALAIAFTLGWRTRIVHPIFLVLWISFIEANDMLGDQGDNMYRIALFFMLFANCGMRWSLDARRREKKFGPTTNESPTTQWGQVQNIAHNLVLVILTAQVSFVYISGALYKAGGDPWSGGYAVYNPLMTDRFGTWPWLSEIATAWGPLVTIATWGSIIMQLAFPFMLLTRPTRVIGLASILTFHIAIAVLMGLPWFSLAMIAIDSIFVTDRTWQNMATGLRQRVRASAEEAREKVPA